MINNMTHITYEHKDIDELLTDKTSPNIPYYSYSLFPMPPGIEMELVGIEKQELARLRELEAQVLSEARTCRRNPVLDCRTLAKKLLQVKPELREWLEVNFKEYL